MNIEKLTGVENDLLAKMPKAGNFSDRHLFLSRHGIYDQWEQVFNQYVSLALDGNVEALKRAIFFVWYQVAEPPQLSGIFNLDTVSVVKVIEYLNGLIEGGIKDSELDWMLPYYYQIADYYIPSGARADAIMLVSKKNNDQFMLRLDKTEFFNRGQLGLYWCSLRL